MNANDDETSDPSPANPFELLNKEPAEASSLRDSFLVSYFKSKHLTDDAANALAAEIWLRHWLYDGECSSVIEQAIGSAQASNQAGFSGQFSAEYELLLAPLRKNDDGKVIPDPKNIDDREKRIWGLLITRVLEFLEADGLMALIPQDTHADDDGVAVPFRFFPSEQSGCQDKNGAVLTGCDWVEVLEELGDLGPFGDNQVLRVWAVFPSSTPPGGASIGLAVALAWARRQARDLPLFSPLAVMATGKLKETEEKISAVDGTGGQADTDTQGGAKGQLAKRLGVKLYVAVDASTDFSAGNGMKVCSFTSSTQWKDALGQIVQAVREMKLVDSPRHLQRVEGEDPELISSGKASEAQLWACWRRLGRLQEHSQSANFAKIDAWRRNAVLKLGYKSIVPGFYDFSIVEDRHGRELRGRRLELQRLDDFLSNPGGMLPVTGPVGHGKSALLTRWRLQFPTNGKLSVFFHYFDQNDDRLRSRAVFYRRLIEHLLIEVEGRPTNREPTEQDVLEAWHLWEQKENRRPLVLVIDGLDEAEQCPPPFPDIFPQNAWLVVSCRSRQGSAQHSAIDSWGKRAGTVCHKPLEVGPLDIPNLCSWLATLVADWTPTSPVVQNLAAKVFDRTGGMALFIHHLWDDLCEAITKGQDLDTVLEKTPVGFVEYLQTQWQRLNDDALEHEKYRLALKIVGYLIAAKGPLTNRELVNLLDLEPGMDLTYLPREAQRWVAVRLVASTDAWGSHFFLNHWLIREAIGSRLRPEVYGKTLFEKCMTQWRDGSPYALRHLPDHLIEKELWRELDKLVTGADADKFQRLQAQSFPDEPALLLISVQRGLETESADIQPKLTTLTELSLTQATLVHKLAKPLMVGNTSSLIPLELAEKMTQLPVHWDPAADFMWHLVAAWQLNKQGRSTERNIHLNALGTVRDVRLPTSWGLLAGAILTETVGPSNPLLRALAEHHVLSTEAVAEMVGRIATKGRFGLQIAMQWLQLVSIDGNAQLRGKITTNLSLSGLYDEAGDIALSAPTIKEQANFLLYIAESAENKVAVTGSLRRWTEELDKRFDECFWKVTVDELMDIRSVIRLLTEPHNRVSLYLLGKFDSQTRHALKGWNGEDFISSQLQERVVTELNEVIKECSVWDKERFANIELSKSVLKLANTNHLESHQARHLNRLLLEDFFGRALSEKKRLPGGDEKRIRSALGRLQVIRARLRLLAGHNDVEDIVDKAVWAVGARDMDSGCFDVQLGLALAFSAASGKRQDEEIRSRLNSRARLHRRNAFRTWLQFRKKPGAHTLEVFQFWLWFNYLTLELVRQGTLPERIGKRWAFRLRQTLLPLNRTDALRIYHLLNIKNLVRQSSDPETDTEPASLTARYLEPAEWDQAIVTAVEAALAATFKDDEVLRLIQRCRSSKDRAKGLARWVKQLVEMDQAESANPALARSRLDEDDKAAAHSLLARQLLAKAETAKACRHSLAAIQHGTDRLSGAGSGQRVGLLTALAAAAQWEGKPLFEAAVTLVENNSFAKPVENAYRYLNLAKAAHRNHWKGEFNYWCGRVHDLVKPNGSIPPPRELTIMILSEYGQALNELKVDSLAQSKSLNRARGAARGEPSLQSRCELICEVAEAYAACGDAQSASELFADMQTEIPTAPEFHAIYRNEYFWRKRGIKPRMLRRYCLGDLILGLGKAAMCFPKTLQQQRAIWHEPWLQWMQATTLHYRQRERITAIYGFIRQNNFYKALQEAGQIAGSNSQALRQAVFRELAICMNWADWALMYTNDQDVKSQDSAIRGWALASAVQGKWDAALDYSRQVSDPAIHANTIRDMAEYSARFGGMYDVRQRAKNLMASQDKDRVLHRIVKALVDRFKQTSTPAQKLAVKQAIFELVPPCAEFFGSTYLMLGCLVEIEPDKWRSVADVLVARGTISLKNKSTMVHSAVAD